jgi:hypothetical protein
MSSLFYTQDAFNLSCEFMFNEVEVRVICLFPINLLLFLLNDFNLNTWKAICTTKVISNNNV